MDNPWTNEAVDAALSKLEACRSATGLSDKEAMRQALCAATQTQYIALTGIEKPSAIISDNGLEVGDWGKNKEGKWCFMPICYD